MGRLSDNMGRLREEIEASRSARLAFTLNLKRDVANMQAGFRHARIAADKRAKAERMQFVGDLAAYVSDMRISVLGMRQKYAEDLAGARQAWLGRLSFMERAGKKETPVNFPIRASAGTRVMEVEEAEVEEAEVEEAEVEEAISDDLTTIAGIGPGRMARLNAAGIISFKDIALCTPEKLLRVLGKPLKTADVERWISEAGLLSGNN